MGSLPKRMVLVLFTIITLFSVAGCGGGGGDSEEGSVDNGSGEPTPAPDPEIKTFSVELSGVEIKQISTGDEVEVDTSSVESGELEYTSP